MADQLQFCFEPVGHEQWENLREYLDEELIHDWCEENQKPRKYLAAELELSPSRLKRKLVPGEGDTSRFTTDDLEMWLKKTRDLRPVHYLYEKYGTSHNEIEWLEARLAEAHARKAGAGQ